MQKKYFLSFLVVYFGMVLLTARDVPAAENAPPDYKNTMSVARETIWKAITSGQGTGAAIAVMDQGEIVYSEGMGVADRSQNRPVDRNTRFNIGSTSKMFAAVAVLLLVDEGKVGLDESVAKYIPEFEMKDKRYKDITVRMLFNHSSGLPGSSFYFGFKADADPHELLFDALKDADLKHDPGAMSIYCNDGFTLAEIIVERVSGKRYMGFLAERIFAPLGMKHSSASLGEINEPNVAEYYDPKTGKKYPRQVVTVYGAGGLASTAEDLCRFGDSFSLGGKSPLSDPSAKEILKAQPTRFSGKLRDRQLFGAFGWDYAGLADYDKKGIRVMGKGGNTAFYNSSLLIIPEKRIALAFCVSGHVDGGAVTRPVLDALMKDKNLMEEKKKAVKKPVPPMPVPPALLQYAGTYIDSEAAVKVVFNKERNGFTLSPAVAAKRGAGKPGSSRNFVYHDGYFYNHEEGVQCYFETVENQAYMVSHGFRTYEFDVLLYQKLAPIKKPLPCTKNLREKAWLLRNAPPSIQGPVTPISLSISKELPGYVDFMGIRKMERADFAGIAATAFRDQTGISFFTRNGNAWAKAGIFLFSTDDGIPRVRNGTTSVRIGDEKGNEWLKLENAAVLSFEKPRDGRVLVSTLDANETLFDTIVDSGEIYAPAGAYVFCAGSPGQTFRVHAR